jgi:hypothetical protein
MRYSYLWTQQFLPSWLQRLFGVPPWRPQRADADLRRPLDTTKVEASEPYPWPADAAGVRLNVNPQAEPWMGSMGGIPVQAVPPEPRWESRLELNFWGLHNGSRQVPLPSVGERWIEGHPLVGGTWDRHWCGTDGVTCWEALGWDDVRRTMGGWAVWRNGQVVEGYAVTRGKVSLVAGLWDRFDPPHRLLMWMSGIDEQGSAPGWPEAGQVFRLSEAAYLRELNKAETVDAIQLLQSLRVYGATFHDRNANRTPAAGIAYVSGAQWAGHGCGRIAIQLSDLEVVTNVHP